MSSKSLIQKRCLHMVSSHRRTRLFDRNGAHFRVHRTQQQQTRGIIGVGTVLRQVLKIRYWLIGGTVGGGIHMNNKYKEWKDSLPEFDWIKDFIPKEKQDKFKSNLLELRDKAMSQDYFNQISNNANQTLDRFRDMLKERQQRQRESAATTDSLDSAEDSSKLIKEVAIIQNRKADNVETRSKEMDYERIRKLQEEVIEIQSKYQKEIERLEKDNKELRKSILIKSDKSTDDRLKKVNKTLIDLYSDVLDEMNDFDVNYATQDHLPRVIVVGDQSAGKTSVLEMIAQARIFPRGAGEMMTRSPVKVTLKEGPYHIARFKDANREYDLSKESELAELRRDIEIRMKSKVRNGQSVSKDVIALTVEGPGIPRMVLVDLPGVISTVTTEMAPDTKKAIEDISMQYMQNPNAIILCIQDGSVDAERSIVTDFVSSVDPNGKRTIFVMTKMDLAEKNLANPARVKKILDGRLFPMKAIGYFAVVTGRGAKDETIQSIRNYEETFFKNSKLCAQGFLNASQCTTQSLSLAVSDCFWRMVKSSVEQQADLYKARKFNLETEWRNTFSNFRELDRDELFEIGKNQILDQIIKISHLNADFWENLLYKNLNNDLQTDIFDNIYLPAAKHPESFNIHADIMMKNWIDHILPEKTVDVGWKVLSHEFAKILQEESNEAVNGGRLSAENDYSMYRKLKETVSADVLKQHKWDQKAFDVLKLIQMNASEDRMISQREAWKDSVKFLQKSINARVKQTQSRVDQLVGPSSTSQWIYWQHQSREQYINSYIKAELEKVVSPSATNLKPELDSEDVLLVKKNLRGKKIEVADEDVHSMWKELYENLFLKSLLSKAHQCEKLFGHHRYKMDSDISCDDVVFFYRIHHILKASAKALRQQITNIEAQRLNRELKDSLDELSQNPDKKAELLAGKRLTLAEELKRVRQIQEKLEEFISALNKEK